MEPVGAGAEHAQRQRELRRVRASLDASRRRGPGDRGPRVEVERLGARLRVDAGRFEHRRRCGRRAGLAARGAASCAAARSRRARARTARRATARRPAGAAWRSIRTSAESTFGGGRNTVRGTAPTTCARAVVRDLDRDRAVVLAPRRRGEPLADLALHHARAATRPSVPPRARARRSASRRCTAGSRRASSRRHRAGSSASRSAVSASPWTTRTSGSVGDDLVERRHHVAVELERGHARRPAEASATVSEPTPGRSRGRGRRARRRRGGRSAAGRCSGRRGSAGRAPGSGAGRARSSSVRSSPGLIAVTRPIVSPSGPPDASVAPRSSIPRRTGASPVESGRSCSKTSGERSMMLPVHASGPRSATRHVATAPVSVSTTRTRVPNGMCRCATSRAGARRVPGRHARLAGRPADRLGPHRDDLGAVGWRRDRSHRLPRATASPARASWYVVRWTPSDPDCTVRRWPSGSEGSACSCTSRGTATSSVTLSRGRVRDRHREPGAERRIERRIDLVARRERARRARRAARRRCVPFDVSEPATLSITSVRSEACGRRPTRRLAVCPEGRPRPIASVSAARWSQRQQYEK